MTTTTLRTGVARLLEEIRSAIRRDGMRLVNKALADEDIIEMHRKMEAARAGR